MRYAGTVEDQVYKAPSERFSDIFAAFGQLPDSFEEYWINSVIVGCQQAGNFSQRIERTRPPMELRYIRDVAGDKGLDWEYNHRVWSLRDLDSWMCKLW